MPDLPVPPLDRDLSTYINWYIQAYNRWEFGANPEHDPRVMDSFIKHAQAIGKDTTDLSTLGASAHTIPPQPLPPPAPAINTRFGEPPAEVAEAIQAAWPPELWVSAAEVSFKESSWNPRARNDTLWRGPCGTQYFIPGIGNAMTEDSRGLFQINVCAHGVGDWYDPLTNATKAHSLYQASGWRPWFYTATALGLL